MTACLQVQADSSSCRCQLCSRLGCLLRSIVALTSPIDQTVGSHVQRPHAHIERCCPSHFRVFLIRSACHQVQTAAKRHRQPQTMPEDQRASSAVSKFGGQHAQLLAAAHSRSFIRRFEPVSIRPQIVPECFASSSVRLSVGSKTRRMFGVGRDGCRMGSREERA